ncbi:MAG: N-acetylmuramoyl-L-alanine amidase family protein [Firmicutes bacterium]|nr:N-acetylmuramoyl-L-alanine amidase family protein [Bacillota bacterium]
MRKFGVSFITVIMLLFCSMTFASAETVLLEYDGGIHEYSGEMYALVVNNKVIDTPLEPIIFNDRALVPVREIFEEVGAKVNYIGETQTVEIFYNSDYIRMTINDNVAYINGEKTNIPDNVVPKLISKLGGETKTMVPVRFISETIGLDVEFDSEDGAILISDGYTMYDEDQTPTIDEVVNTQESEAQDDTADISVTPYICDVSYEITDDTNVRVIVTTDSDILGYSDFTLSSPERVILDLANAKLNVSEETISVNSSGVTSIRLGDNDERARVVVDVTNLQSYYIEEIASNMLAVNVTTKETASPTAAPSDETEQSGNVSVTPDSSKLIVLDAGHGGTDPGAIGYIDGEQILEKDLTLEITYKVKEILEEAGYTVSMTRTGDTLPSLTERPAQANEENAAVFVSIHINSVENAPEANGTEVYYATENNGDEYGTTSEKLATNILNRMLYYMGSTNRGVKTAEHAVTRRCEMPAALVEVGFITNAEEVYNMTTEEYQYKAAQGIAEGIMITLKDITVPD